MLEKLKQTGRTNEVNIGWYHSHPGYGCWLSSTDINTQKAFERQEARTVAVVICALTSVYPDPSTCHLSPWQTLPPNPPKVPASGFSFALRIPLLPPQL